MGAALRRRSYRGALVGFAIMVATPALLTGLYWHGIAADRFVTEFRYSVRSGAAMAGGGGDSMLQGSGALVFASDSFILEDYVASEAALAGVAATLPIREMLGRDGGDPLRRYDPDAPLEELTRHWRDAVTVRFDAITGITTVAVSLFSAEDSRAVGAALVDSLRELVDGLSAEARREMTAFVAREYDAAVAELAEARRRIEVFRRDNLVISPDEEATIGSGIIADLSNQLSTARVTLRALRVQSPESPRIPALENQIRALQAQLEAETARRGGEAHIAASDALPAQLATFDALRSDYEIAQANLLATRALRQQAEAFATLGQAELVVFVPPRAAAVATEPRRWLETAKATALAFAVWVIARIFLASLRT